MYQRRSKRIKGKQKRLIKLKKNLKLTKCKKTVKIENLQKIFEINPLKTSGLINNDMETDKNKDNKPREQILEDTDMDKMSKSMLYLSDYINEAFVTNNVDFWWHIRESVIDHTYKWVIKDYSIKCQIHDLIYTNFALSEPDWSLTLQQDKLMLTNHDQFSKSVVSGVFKIDGKKKQLSMTFDHNFAHEKCLIIKDFISYQEIVQHSKDFLPDDTLTILCEFKETKLLVESRRNNNKHLLKENYVSDFLASHFEMPLYYDIEFFVAGAKFTAHKVLIKLRCPKFLEEICFQNPNINLIEIRSITPTIFREFLRFIYTNEFNEIESTAEALISLANDYDFTSLKAKCEDFLIKSLNSNNAIHLFTIGRTLACAKLMAKAKDFIMENVHHLTFDEFYTQFYLYMNNIYKQVDSHVRSLPTRNNERIQEIIQETQQWVFQNLSKKNKILNFPLINIEMDKNILNFNFKEDNLGNISLSVTPRLANDIKQINVEIVVKNDEDCIIYLKCRGTSDFTNESTRILFEDIIKSNYFKKEKNTFNIYSCIWILKDVDSTIQSITMKDKNNINREKEYTLCKVLNRLFEEMTDSDVLIRAGKEEFRVHKFIVGPHCKVFNDLFMDHNFKHERTTCVQITIDFRSDLIREMLRFFYTGKIHNLYDNLPELLKLTFILNINCKLKNMCENALSSTININNVLDILKLADMYNGQLLKKECLSFLQENASNIPNLMTRLDKAQLNNMRYDTLQQITKVNLPYTSIIFYTKNLEIKKLTSSLNILITEKNDITRDRLIKSKKISFTVNRVQTASTTKTI